MDYLRQMPMGFGGMGQMGGFPPQGGFGGWVDSQDTAVIVVWGEDSQAMEVIAVWEELQGMLDMVDMVLEDTQVMAASQERQDMVDLAAWVAIQAMAVSAA